MTEDETRQDLLTLDDAVALLGTSRPTLYRWLRAGKIRGLKVGRQWRFRREEIARFLDGEAPSVSLPSSIEPLLEALAERLGTLGADCPGTTGDPAHDAVSRMICLAVAMRASDISLEPRYLADGDNHALLRYRHDGLMHDAFAIDLRLMPGLAARWKTLAGCDPHSVDLPQDGRIELTIAGKPYDVRVASIPTTLGESVTARVLYRTSIAHPLETLQYLPEDLARMREALAAPSGMIVCAGPTGSGKTSTLYAMLGERVAPERKVLTIEDPVHYRLPGVVQTQVDARAGRTVERLLRSALCSDPDVVVAPELNSREALAIAIQLGLTGHQVLTSLHCGDAIAGIVRLAELSGEPYLLADALRLVVCQRLVRRLCTACSRALSDEERAARRDELAPLAREAGLDAARIGEDWRAPVGCAECADVGYRGRIVVAECVTMTPALAARLSRGEGDDGLRQAVLDGGGQTMLAHALLRVGDGVTSLAEIRRVMGVALR